MPSIESDVPHTSTTSHLIAVYESGKPRGIEPSATESIRRVEVSPLVSDQLLQRAEAVAEVAWAVQRAREGEYDWLDSPSLDDGLLKVLQVNPDDAYAHSLLSRMYRLKADRLAARGTPSDDIRLAELWDKVESHAKTALPLEKRPVNAREVALQSLAHQQIHAEDHAAAARSLAELVQMRRSAVDWYNLGLCYGKLRRSSDAEKAFRQAIRLDGTYVAPYRSLSILYRRVNPAASRQLAEISQRLMMEP
jgi:tetratricopeptide (TPR) repeat protein